MALSFGSNKYYEQPLGNSYCALDNTRLAIAESISEKDGLLKWLQMKNTVHVSILKQITPTLLFWDYLSYFHYFKVS